MFHSESTHLNTRQAGLELGLTSMSIVQHITSGNLKAVKLGHCWEIYRPDFEKFKAEYQAGKYSTGKYPEEIEAERRANREALELQRRFLAAGGKS